MGRIGRRKSAVKLIVLAAVLLTATILAGVLIQNQNQTTNRLICQNIFLHINTPTNQYISAKAYVSITSPSDGEILPTENVGVTWTSNETVDHYETRLDGGGWTNVGTNTSQTFTNLSEGLHTVEVMVFDESAGNDTDDVTFTVDTTSPTVTITYPEDDALLPTGDLTVTWNSVDTDIAYYNVSVDGGAWENMGLNTGYDLIGLPDDPHTFNVTAVDQAGNTGFDVVSFTVDTTSPTVNITYPSDDALLSSSDVTVTWNSPDSDIAYYNVSIDGGAWENVGLNTSYDLSLGDGLHNVNVTAVDLAGLSGFDSVSFTVDTTPPTVNITSPSSDSVNTGVIWINGTFDGTGSNVVSITINESARFELVEPSGAGPFGESGSYAFRSSTTIPTGGLSVLVTVEDQANLTGTATVNFIVDQDIPIVTIDQPPSDDTINTGVIWINGTYDGTGSQVTSITINETTWFELVEPSGAGPYSESGTYAFRNKTTIPTGAYVVLVMIEDQANLTGTATRQVMVDQDNPVITITSPASDTTVNSGVIWVNGSYDGTGSIVQSIVINDSRFDLVAGPPFAEIGFYSFRNNTDIPTGEFGVLVTVTDGAGFTGSAVRHVIVDQTLPIVVITVPVNDSIVNTGIIWINGTYDGTGSSITGIVCNDTRFTLQTSPPFGVTGTYSFMNNTPITTGEFWVQVTITDQAGLTGTATRHVIVDQDNPTVVINNPSSDSTVNTGVIWINGTYDGTGSQITNLTINDTRFTLQTSPPFGINGAYSFKNNTPIATGEFGIQVTVTDQASLIGTASRHVIVDQDNPTVMITQPSSDSTVITGVIWINGTYNGTGSTVQSIVINDSSFVLVVGSPFGVTGAYSFRNNTAIPTGEFGVRVTVTDGAGFTVYTERHVIVDQTLPLVSITVPASDTTINTGDIWIRGSYDGTGSSVTTISCNDSRFTLVNVPPFGVTGTYSFVNNTPIATGEFEVQLTVYDQAGLTGVATRHVIVDQDNPTVIITIPTDDTTVGTGVIWVNGSYDGTGSTVQSIVINDSRFYLVAGSPFGVTGFYSFRNNTSIPTEEFGLRVTVTDGVGFTGNAVRHMIVDQSSPIVSVTVPASDITVNSGVIWVNGSYDGTGSRVTTISCDDSRFNLQTSPPFGVTGTYSFVNNTPINTEKFWVQITVSDQAGLTGIAQRYVIVDQSLPLISITSPASDTTVNSGVIWVNGSYDGTGSIVQSIVINDSRFDLVAGPPFAEIGFYSFRNNTDIPTGEFGVLVTVTDGAGFTGSAVRHVIVDQTLPIVVITVPVNDSIVNTGIIWINGTYDGRGDSITAISCNDSRFTLQNSPPFGVSGTYGFVNNTPVATGEFWIQINVTDQWGLIGMAQRYVRVDQNKPTVTITEPASDSTVDTSVIYISGSYNGTGSNIINIVCNDTRFELFNSPPFGVTGTYTFLNNISIPTSRFWIQITVTDEVGLNETALRYVIVDQDLPIVNIIIPANDSAVNTGIIWINGTYNGTGSAVQSFTINDSRFLLGVGPPFGEIGTYSFWNNTPIPTGEFWVNLTIKDQANFTKTALRHVIVDQTVPSMSITVPVDDTTVNTGVIWINGTYDGTGSGIVQISCNDTRFTLQISQPYGEVGAFSFSNKTPISTGIFYVQVSVFDGANYNDSKVRRIVVDQSPPTVTVTTPFSDTTINVGTIIIRGEYNGTGSNVQQITWNDTRFTLQTSAPFGVTGTYVLVNNTPIYDGRHWVMIRVNDTAGYESFKIRCVLVNQSGVTGSFSMELNSSGDNQYIPAYPYAGVELFMNTTNPVCVYITRTTTNLGGGAPAGFGFSGSFWSISVNDTSAVKGVRIIIRYSNDTIKNAGIDVASLRIVYWDDTSRRWIEIPSTLEMENNMITVDTNHLTNFAIVGTLIIPITPGIPFYLQFLLISLQLPSGSNTLVYLALGLAIIALVTVIGVLLMGGRKRREAIEAVAPPTLVRTETSAKPGCFYCGSDIPGDSEYCPYCGETRARCSVCNRYMLSGERFAECPYCDAVSHTDHLLEWVNSKGYCPACKEKLFPSHVKLKDYFERR